MTARGVDEITGDRQLSDIERDALTEIANIGVSRAASSLRKMVDRQVLLSVPSVEVVTHQSAADLIGQRESDDLIAVMQAFSGAFDGRAMLIFPQKNGVELTRAVLGSDVSPDEISSMEEEALAETGNVILNGCVGTMANMLNQPLSLSLPTIVRGTGQELFTVKCPPPEQGLVLFFFINFAVEGRDIRGYIAMLMDVPSLAALKVLIGEFIARVMHDDLGKPGLDPAE